MAEQEGCVVGDFLPLHPSLPEPLKGALKKIERHGDSVGKLLYQAADLKQWGLGWITDLCDWKYMETVLSCEGCWNLKWNVMLLFKSV